ncbi:anti-sigma factor RsiW [Constrictibacter sp. MBR-5]|uniref:anti-sigma factor family protein n=1 Tax=Constrictibacter sp. MBR-5 TaxID=3156467 RepID=UPI003396CF49
MARPEMVSEEDIQEYIDGRASPALRAQVDAFLAANPKRQAEVQALLRQQEALRRLGTEILAEPIPDRLQEILRRIPDKRR